MTPDATQTGSAGDEPLRRGTPAGSLRYFSVLFAPEPCRAMLTALYAFEAELRDTVGARSHDIAHTRLQWWRGEIDRLSAGHAQHPVTVVLQGLRDCSSGDLALLHEMLVAADLDLARMTYTSARELDAYCFRASGALQTLAAAVLAGSRPLSEAERNFARSLGVALRQAEMLRDLRRDLAQGRLYAPLDALDAAGIDPRRLMSAELPDDLDTVFGTWRARVAAELARLPGTLAPPERRTQRAGLVLAALHERLLARLRPGPARAESTVDLSPFSRLWTAWRTAVRYA